MSRYPRQTLPSPLGMGTALDPAELPITRARLIRGFLPARNGKLNVSNPLQRIPQTAFLDPYTFSDYVGTVSGLSYYYNPQPPTQAEFNAGQYRRDRLVTVKNGVDLYVHTVTYDLAELEMVFGDAVWVGQLQSVETGGRPENQNIRTVQYKDEMFIVAGDGSTPMRLYLDASDNPFLWQLGITAPTGAPSATNAGAGVVTGPAIYTYTWADEKGRESSPSLSTTITPSPSPASVNVGFVWSTDLQVQSVNIYRTTAGGSIGYLIATITNRATTSYTDNNADGDITGNQQSPLIGGNEPPYRASAIEMHKSRLFLNNRHIYDDHTAVDTLTQLQMSNLNAPTQFNLVPANNAEDENYGLALSVGFRDADEITGLRSNGSILAIPTRTSWHHLYGDDFSSSPFFIRFQHNVGCESIDSLVEGDGMLFFLGRDGIYMTAFIDGFQPRKLSVDIDDQWSGTITALYP